MWRSNLAVVTERRGLTQAELMRMTGLSKRTIASAYHSWEVSTPTMLRIARVLGVPLAELDPLAAGNSPAARTAMKRRRAREQQLSAPPCPTPPLARDEPYSGYS